jgi:steroid 5-alpha reductase family enzyme
LIAWPAWLEALAWVLGGMTIAWVASWWLENVSIVDGLWGLGHLVAIAVYAARLEMLGPRAPWIWVLGTLWALRLSLTIFWRNRGQGEDRRYRAMREKVGATFAWRSWVTVFLLQGTLLWILAMPWAAALGAGAGTTRPLGAWDALGVVLWCVGFGFEAIGDEQLRRFKADPANARRVMDRGLWRLTRHPNYFGEATLWWGFYAFAVGAGAPWTVASPLALTFLLLKVSGVALLEKTIADRRPEYRDYIARTSAFLPWPPRRSPAPSSSPPH